MALAIFSTKDTKHKPYKILNTSHCNRGQNYICSIFSKEHTIENQPFVDLKFFSTNLSHPLKASLNGKCPYEQMIKVTLIFELYLNR